MTGGKGAQWWTSFGIIPLASLLLLLVAGVVVLNISWWLISLCFIWVLQLKTSSGMFGCPCDSDASTWACQIITIGPDCMAARVFESYCLMVKVSGCIGTFLSKNGIKRWKLYPCDRLSNSTKHSFFAWFVTCLWSVNTIALKSEVRSSLCLSYLILIILNNLTRHWEMETWHLLFCRMKDFMF